MQTQDSLLQHWRARQSGTKFALNAIQNYSLKWHSLPIILQTFFYNHFLRNKALVFKWISLSNIYSGYEPLYHNTILLYHPDSTGTMGSSLPKPILSLWLHYIMTNNHWCNHLLCLYGIRGSRASSPSPPRDPVLAVGQVEQHFPCYSALNQCYCKSTEIRSLWWAIIPLRSQD